MSFMDSYKHLEKLCNEIFRIDTRGISTYIEEMEHSTNGNFYVENWNEDYKKLKHYRYLRNKISHDPDCTEENMCAVKDTQWIQNFYSRIMNQTDPLSLYFNHTRNKVVSPPNKQKTTTFNNCEYNNHEYNQYKYNKKSAKNSTYLPIFMFALIITVFIMFINLLLKI